MEKNRIQRKKAASMDELIGEYIREMKIAAGLNTQLVFDAWDEVSGASIHTIGRFYRNGTLFITLDSSVVRNRLSFQKDALVRSMNARLEADRLFVKDDPNVGLINELVLK